MNLKIFHKEKGHDIGSSHKMTSHVDIDYIDILTEVVQLGRDKNRNRRNQVCGCDRQPANTYPIVPISLIC